MNKSRDQSRQASWKQGAFRSFSWRGVLSSQNNDVASWAADVELEHGRERGVWLGSVEGGAGGGLRGWSVSTQPCSSVQGLELCASLTELFKRASKDSS